LNPQVSFGLETQIAADVPAIPHAIEYTEPSPIGLRVAHNVMLRTFPGTDHVQARNDFYFWEEAGCTAVQNITTNYAPDKYWIETNKGGFMFESLDNGEPLEAAFVVPSDYREGSMKEFLREEQKRIYGPDYMNRAPNYVLSTLSQRDYYEQTKAKRPNDR